MLFSSATFVFLFLPIVCAIYLLAKKELHNPILLIASIIFYAWGEPSYLSIMLLTIIISYFGALFIDKFQNHKKAILIGTMLLDLSFLMYFKYFNFFIDNINLLFHSNVDFIKVVMPIGISFYTFQALSYVIDVYKKEVNVQKNFYKLALYICLFPQLVAGPIVKYHDVEKEIENRDVTFDNVSLGVKRFIIGLSKKMIIANTLGAVVDKIFEQCPDAFSSFVAWIGGFAYIMQLYFDFSGYSDMAIGLGLIFGFKFLENFNYPYISKSITEFWRRWHISLSTWFKLYIYIPLGGNRVGKLLHYRNLMIVFFVTGFWHGAGWTFIVWGIWHGLFIVIEKATGLAKETQNKLANIFKHVYAILVVTIGFVVFRASDITYALKYVKRMFSFSSAPANAYPLTYYGGVVEILISIIAVLCAIGLFSGMLEYAERNKFTKATVNLWLIVLLIFSLSLIAASTYNPFIYFNF
ncbi:MAG: MBOAT family O-acyltransferase [Candidatus Gastranaerophilaceae bacterium]